MHLLLDMHRQACFAYLTRWKHPILVLQKVTLLSGGDGGDSLHKKHKISENGWIAISKSKLVNELNRLIKLYPLIFFVFIYTSKFYRLTASHKLLYLFQRLYGNVKGIV